MLGYAHPDHLKAVLTPAQVDDWRRVLAAHPLGERREDWRVAMLTSRMLACHVKDPPSAEELLPKFKAARRRARPWQSIRSSLRQHLTRRAATLKAQGPAAG